MQKTTGDAQNEIHSISDSDAHYSLVYQFLWSKYSQAVGFIVTGAAGSVLAGLQIITSDTNLGIENAESSFWILVSLSVGMLALALSMLWRLTTQFMMEKEVFGSKKSALEYHRRAELPVTAWALKPKTSNAIEAAHRVLPFACIFLVLATWTTMAWHVFSHIL